MAIAKGAPTQRSRILIPWSKSKIVIIREKSAPCRTDGQKISDEGLARVRDFIKSMRKVITPHRVINREA